MLCWRAVTTCYFYDHDLGEGVIFPCLFNYSRQQNGETKVLCCSFKPDVLLSHPSWQQLLCYKVIWQSHQVLAQLLTNSLDFNQFVTRCGKCSLWTEFTSLSRDLGWRAQMWFYIQTFSGQLQKKKCMNKYRSNDYSNYYHSSLIFIPPSVSAGFIFTSTRRSVFLYFHLPPCLQLLHVCLCRPPVQQIPSLSFCSQLDRDTSTLRWASRKPSSLLTGRLHPCISWFLFLSDPPTLDLSYNLSQAEMADKCPCCGYNPSTPVSLSLSLSRSLSCVVLKWRPSGVQHFYNIIK